MARGAQGPGPKTEQRLVEREREVRAGEAERTPTLSADLDRLFEAHRPKILRLCTRLLRNPAKAEEIVQEAQVVAWSKLPDFDDERRFGPWIYGIARNLCLNASRKRGELLTHDGVLEPGGVSATALSELRIEERRSLLQAAALAALDDREQEVIHLRYVEGLPLEQIDSALGLTGSGSRAVLQRVKRKLRKELEARLEGLGHGRSFVHLSES